MEIYTIIFFYSDGTTHTFNAGSVASATAIEAGVLESWYENTMKLPSIVNRYYLTGMVLINNKYQTVIENKTYIERGAVNESCNGVM